MYIGVRSRFVLVASLQGLLITAKDEAFDLVRIHNALKTHDIVHSSLTKLFENLHDRIPYIVQTTLCVLV